VISVPNTWWTSISTVIALWALWSSLYGVRLVAALLAVRRAKTSSRPFPTTVERLLRQWTRAREQGRRATLVVSDRVSAAAVLGCGSPTIAVAPTLVQHLSAEELDRVIVHEWAHVQRRDDVAQVVQLVVRLIAGWHPAVWWIDRRLEMEREVACDEMTVAVTGSPKAYAACLVKLASLPLARLDTLPALGALSSTGLAGRITRILARRALPSPAWSCAGATVAIAVLCALSMAAGGLRLIETAAVLSSDLWVPRPIAGARAVQPNAFEMSPAIDRAPLQVAPTASRGSARSAGSTRIPPPRVASPPAGAIQTGPPAAPVQMASASPVESQGEADAPAVYMEPVNSPDARGPVLPIDSVQVLPTLLPVQPPAAEAPTRSPWNAAANAGVAFGRGSKNAGVATAGFFNRFARRFARSF